MQEPDRFRAEVSRNIRGLGRDTALQALSTRWINAVAPHRYAYNFRWMGRPVIQLPQDMVAMQEIIWSVRPDLIIETGIAHGGSLVYYASLLELLGGNRIVIGVDIEIRPHNLRAIKAHPMARRIRLVQGSSVDPATVERVTALARGRKRVLVTLDSNHTHAHVLSELQLYSPFVTKGSYLVVFDTVVEDMPKALFPNRPWGPGDNPKTAVHEFLRTNDRFVIDRDIQHKLLLTVAPDGYLQCRKGLARPARRAGSRQ